MSTQKTLGPKESVFNKTSKPVVSSNEKERKKPTKIPSTLEYQVWLYKIKDKQEIYSIQIFTEKSLSEAEKFLKNVKKDESDQEEWICKILFVEKCNKKIKNKHVASQWKWKRINPTSPFEWVKTAQQFVFQKSSTSD